MSNSSTEYIKQSLLHPKWWSIMGRRSDQIRHETVSRCDIYAETHIKLILGEEGVSLEIWNNSRIWIGYVKLWQPAAVGYSRNPQMLSAFSLTAYRSV